MPLSVRAIPSWDVDKVWGRVEHLIKRATNRMNGRQSSDSIKELIEATSAQLWIVDGYKAAVVTEIVAYPLKKYCRIVLVAGDGLNEWKHLIKPIELWAKSIGCSGMEAIARDGWPMVTDYKKTHIFIEKEF